MPGKSDWLAHDLPYEGEADLVSRVVTRDVPTAPIGSTIGGVRGALDDSPFGELVVVNDHRIVLGRLAASAAREASDGLLVVELMHEGPTTVRPAEEVDGLLHRMGHAEVGHVLVTRADGVLVGVLDAGALRDHPAQPHRHG